MKSIKRTSLKGWMVVLALTLSSVVMAQSAPPPVPSVGQMLQEHGLSYTLSDAAGWYQVALEKRYNAFQNAELKMRLDERVAAVGMGRREASRMRDVNAIQGPATPDDGGELAAASTNAYARAKEAYSTWTSGKSYEQKAAAKKLYVSWMTYMDALTVATGNPVLFESDNPVAANAYHQAINEFKVDEI